MLTDDQRIGAVAPPPLLATAQPSAQSNTTGPPTRITDPNYAGLPPWTEGFLLYRDQDGRLYAYGEVGDSLVYVVHRRWRGMPLRDKAENYGVNVKSLQGHANGVVTTNEPGFRETLDAKTSVPVAMLGGSDYGQFYGASVGTWVIGVSIVIAGLLGLIGFRRRSR